MPSIFRTRLTAGSQPVTESGSWTGLQFIPGSKNWQWVVYYEAKWSGNMANMIDLPLFLLFMLLCSHWVAFCCTISFFFLRSLARSTARRFEFSFSWCSSAVKVKVIWNWNWMYEKKGTHQVWEFFLMGVVHGQLAPLGWLHWNVLACLMTSWNK